MSTRYLRGSIIKSRHDPLDKGLVGEWRFDKNTGLILPEQSGRNVRGTIVAADWATSKFGLALSFDGVNSYVEMTNAPDHSVVSLSVFVFAKPGDVVDKQVFISDSNFGNNGYRLYSNATKLTAVLGDGGATLIEEDAGTVDTTWQLLGFTFDRPDVTLYRNTSIVKTGAFDSDITQSTNTLDFGQTTGDNWRFYGEIGCIRIYNRALIASEVMALYQIFRRRMQTFGGERPFRIGVAEAACVTTVTVTVTTTVTVTVMQ